jgi:hypothetical protein
MTPDDLVEIERIRQLKYRYVRLLDLKEWDEMAGLFVDDATAWYGGGAHSLTGRDEIMGFLRSTMSSTSVLSSHKVHQPEITLTGPDTARGIWALDDVVILGDASLVVRGASYYDDRYVVGGGEWRIQHTGYRRVFEEIAPRSPKTRLTASWWETDGRSSLG